VGFKQIPRFCAGSFLAFWSVALKLIDRDGHPSFAAAWTITVRSKLQASAWVQNSLPTGAGVVGPKQATHNEITPFSAGR
jgi:hypothetical protein